LIVRFADFQFIGKASLKHVWQTFASKKMDFDLRNEHRDIEMDRQFSSHSIHLDLKREETRE